MILILYVNSITKSYASILFIFLNDHNANTEILILR